MEDAIHIVIDTDENYADFALIVINSIVHNHPVTGKKLCFHIFTNKLSEETRRRFFTYNSSRVEVEEQVVDCERFKKRWDGVCSPMYFRLELPELLPEVSRVIYLDCDVIVLDDIEKLWQVDLQGKAIAAAGDRAGLQEKRKHYNAEGIMFNSGVMIMDLSMWRRENHVEGLVKYWKENRDSMHFADQGLLNAYFGTAYTMLDQRWNIINSVYRNPTVPGMYSDEEVTEAIRNPGIVHFTGHHKPWKFFKRFHHPYGYTFCLCALDTPIGFWKKVKLWLKLHLNGRFVDSPKKVPWGKKDIKKIRW